MQASDLVQIVAPIAARTWEMRAKLAGNVQSTGRVPIQFTEPVVILGMRPTVSIASNPAGLMISNPTTDYVDVLLDANGDTRYTTRFDNLSGSVEQGQLVRLSSLLDSIGGARLLMLDLPGTSPVLGINFAWSHDVTSGLTVPDVLVSLSLWVRYKREM